MLYEIIKKPYVGILLLMILLLSSFLLMNKSENISSPEQPNIIFLMADDMGYGDAGFMGNEIIKTPELDKMAANGVVFNRFYSGAAVCSPTRGTVLTGRHHYRYGIFSASVGYLRAEEITLASMCKEKGYTTGHFGKWHLAPLALEGRVLPEYAKQRERKYAPPWERNYDESFVTECNTPTWNVLDSDVYDVNSKFGFFHNGVEVTDNMEGAAAKVVMDRAIPFIQSAAKLDKPFMTTIWFLEPHDPVVAGPEHKAIYSEYSDDEQHYYGTITAMDEQIGRLRNELRKLGIDKNTMLWFVSDNGPAHLGEPDSEEWWFTRSRGVTGGLRARKRSFFEGGIRVPALLEWPGHAEAGKVIDTPGSTLDYFPTVKNILGYEMPDDRPIDGVDLLPIINGKITSRPKPIPFGKPGGSGKGSASSPAYALIDNNMKFMTNLSENGGEDLLFDLDKDFAEETNIIEDYPEIAERMKDEMSELVESFKRSHAGDDYSTPFTPVDKFPNPAGRQIKNNIIPFIIFQNVDGKETDREVLVHFPRNHDENKKYPVVFAFHGHGGRAEEWIGEFSKFVNAGEFIGIYPQGYNKAWNIGVEDTNADDVEFVNMIIERLKKYPSLDLNRLYAIGYSNGSALVNKLGMETNHFRAIAACASQLINGQEPVENLKPVSVYQLCGAVDKIIPYEGGLSPVGHVFLSAKESAEKWAEQFNCSMTPKVELIGSDSLFIYSDCDSDREIRLHRVENGNHGLNQENDPDFYFRIWKFLKSQ